MTFSQIQKALLGLLLCIACSPIVQGTAKPTPAKRAAKEAAKPSFKGAAKTVIAAQPLKPKTLQRANTSSQLKPATKPQPVTTTDQGTEPDPEAKLKSVEELDNEYGAATAEFDGSEHKDDDTVKTKFTEYETAHNTAKASTEKYYESQAKVEEAETSLKKNNPAFGQTVEEVDITDQEKPTLPIAKKPSALPRTNTTPLTRAKSAPVLQKPKSATKLTSKK